MNAPIGRPRKHTDKINFAGKTCRVHGCTKPVVVTRIGALYPLCNNHATRHKIKGSATVVSLKSLFRMPNDYAAGPRRPYVKLRKYINESLKRDVDYYGAPSDMPDRQSLTDGIHHLQKYIDRSPAVYLRDIPKGKSSKDVVNARVDAWFYRCRVGNIRAHWIANRFLCMGIMRAYVGPGWTGGDDHLFGVQVGNECRLMSPREIKKFNKPYIDDRGVPKYEIITRQQETASFNKRLFDRILGISPVLTDDRSWISHLDRRSSPFLTYVKHRIAGWNEAESGMTTWRKEEEPGSPYELR